MNYDILDKIKLGAKLSSFKPDSIMSEEFISRYNRLFKVNGFNYRIFHNMVDEGLKSEDKSIKSLCESLRDSVVNKFSTSYRFALVMESLDENSDAYKDLEHLLHYSENDLKESISKGVLQKYRYIDGLMQLDDEIGEGLRVSNKILSENFVTYSPVSFTEIHNGSMFFMLEGKTFRYDPKKGIFEDTAPSRKFEVVNAAIERIPYDIDNNSFETESPIGNVKVTDAGNIEVDGKPMKPEEFKKALKDALEDLDSEKAQEAAKNGDAIVTIVENFERITYLDEIKTTKNVNSNESVSIMTHKNGFYMFENFAHSITFNKYLSINEALSVHRELTGTNIKSLFSKHVINENNLEVVRLSHNEECESNINELETRLQEVEKELAVSDPGSEAHEEYSEIKEKIEESIRCIRASMI